ncbi:MAG: DNA replication/repair protein RecF [Micrococcales bacterium]
MYIKHLSLANFRNYGSVDVELSRGVNLFVGENGHGKTNLVEAIGYLSTLRSHRVAGYEALIRVAEDCNSATLRALAHHQDRDVLVDYQLNRGSANRAAINKNQLSRPRDILGSILSVTFAPEDVELVRGQPSSRRDFIDDLLIQLAPRFSGVITDYERVLKQRNTLLRTARQTGAKGTALSTLDAWDEQLVRLGAELIAARVALVNKLVPHLVESYKTIAQASSTARILVKSSITAKVILNDDDSDDLETINTDDAAVIEKIYRERLTELRSKELERGITLIGPHRDDLILQLNDLPAKTHSSSGETWSLALALRLAALELLRVDGRAGDPVLILDDVFATLDAGRRSRLAKLVSTNEQVLITAAVAEDVPSELQAKVFHVIEGEVTVG